VRRKTPQGVSAKSIRQADNGPERPLPGDGRTETSHHGLAYSMEEILTDVLVIGSGLAGMVSALEAEKSGLSVALVSKFAIGMGTNTSMANGAFTAANSRFSEADHLRQTFETGKGLSQLKRVKTTVDGAREAIEKVREYGVPLTEWGIGYVVDRPAESSQLPGVLLVKPLVERLKSSSIQLLPGVIIFDLVVEEGEVRGAFGFLKDGRPCLIRSKATLLAAGGAGAAYARNDNQRTILGDGYALALRAGLPLCDLEFVQFYPLVLAEPRLSTFILLPPYPKEARLFDDRREDLLEKLGIGDDITQAVITQRDRFSISLYEASENGDVYFDLTRVPEEEWHLYPLNFLTKSKFPFRERPFLVLPAVHFLMGGVETDEDGGTSLAGLFAAGEVVWGLHGANRLGGNALTECAVSGIRAGISAGRYAGSKQIGDVSTRKWEKRAGDYLKKRRGGFDPPAKLLKEMKEIAWKRTGPIREEVFLKEGLEQLASVEKRIESVYPASVKDLFRKRDLENVALLLRAVLEGSLRRRESRGSFCRRDFPDQDDANWAKNSCYSLDHGVFQITDRPVDAESNSESGMGNEK
jgi:succinate dehydrogenase/fumarate reductase flavoprotein subunit